MAIAAGSSVDAARHSATYAPKEELELEELEAPAAAAGQASASAPLMDDAPLLTPLCHGRWVRRRSASSGASEFEVRPAARAGTPPAAGPSSSDLLVPAEGPRAKPAPGAGGLWANAGALLLVVAGPAAAAALSFGIPYHAVQDRVARAFLFALVGALGAACNMSVWFSVFLRVPLRRVAPTYVPLFLALCSASFAALNAAVDLTSVPFAYLACLGLLMLANQLCSRLLARRWARRPLYPDPGGGGVGPPPDLARAIADLGKFQAMLQLIVAVLIGYLFVFSAAHHSLLQVATNAANSSLCLLLIFLGLRAFDRPLAAALPHGDAGVLAVLTWMLSVRVFRQLAFFRVRSSYVYLASLAADLAALLPPAPLLARLARPLVRRAPALLRLVFADPPAAPEPEPRVLPLPPDSPAATDDFARRSTDGGGGGGGVEVRPLAADDEEAPDAEPAPPPDGEAWVFGVHTGVRSMLLWHALVSWVAAAVFATVVVVARWGPGAANFPYSPATFDDAACYNALFFSLVTAGVHAVVVAAFHVAARFSPRLRDRLGLAASWRLLRARAPALAMAFASCSSISFMNLYRPANLYSFVFPESYPPPSPAYN